MAKVEQIPWYREKLVWLIIAIPASSIIFGIFMLTMAINGKDTLIRDDYYKDGLMINQEIERDLKAHQLGLTAELILDGTQVTVRLSSNQVLGSSELIKLQLLHPTLADNDIELMMINDGDHFRANIEKPINGRRYVQLSNQNDEWRLKGESWFPSDQPVKLESSVRVRNE